MPAIALNFHGPISHPATTKLRNALCAISNELATDANGKATTEYRYDALFLLMNSSGGGLDDGFSLFNLLKSLRLPLTTVNMGQVASIANVPFLAGSRRICCEHAYFHFHNFDWAYPAAHTLSRDQFKDHSQILDQMRTMNLALLKSQSSLTDSDLQTLKLLDDPVVKDASFAKQKGIVHEIEFPKLPPGTPIINVDY